MRVSLEQVYLLFSIDSDAEAEKIQAMKKMLIELRSGEISDTIIKELMKKIQGLPADKDPDTKKKRDMLLRAIEYAFKNIQVCS